MDKETGSFAEVIKAVVAEERKRLDAHPAVEALIAYQAGELPDQERDQFRRHLARCPRCTATVLDLASFPDLESRRPEVDPEAAHEDDWRAIRRQLHESPVPAHPPAAGRSLGVYRALAAGLALLVIGFSFSTVRLANRVSELSRPRANVLVHDLLPVEEGGTRAHGGLEILEIPDGVEYVVLVLNVEDVADHRDYRITIVGRDGEVFFQRHGLVPTPEGSFSIELPRDRLPTDDVRFQLEGLDDAQALPLAAYTLRIVADTSV